MCRSSYMCWTCGPTGCLGLWPFSTPRCSRNSVSRNGSDVPTGQLCHAIPQDSCDNWPLSTHFSKCNAHADHDDIGSIAKEIAADPDDPPAQRSKFGIAIDIGSALRGIRPMLCTVEFDRNLQFAVLHVQTRERIIEAVQDADLRFGLRQTRVHEQESRPGFLW